MGMLLYLHIYLVHNISCNTSSEPAIPATGIYCKPIIIKDNYYAAFAGSHLPSELLILSVNLHTEKYSFPRRFKTVSFECKYLVVSAFQKSVKINLCT